MMIGIDFGGTKINGIVLDEFGTDMGVVVSRRRLTTIVNRLK